jgi:hypothetical protein
MVMEDFPFTGETILQVQQVILELRYNICSFLSMGVRNVIVQMLTKKPTERPTLDHSMESYC